MRKLCGFIIAIILSQSVWASAQTVTLAIKNMSCGMCPITVKKSLQKVKGVNKVTVSFEQQTATVTYDNKTTSLVALISATTNAGYPATLKK